MPETVLKVLRMLADGVRGPLVHEVIDLFEGELAGHASVPEAAAPASGAPSQEGAQQ